MIFSMYRDHERQDKKKKRRKNRKTLILCYITIERPEKEQTPKFNENIKQLKPFGFYDYNKLQKDSFCVLSDSGSLAEESNIMGFPAVSIRTSTERPEAVDKGSIILGGITFDSITQAMEVVVKQKQMGEILVKAIDYTDINVSTKVVNVIQGYTSVINKFIWRK